MTTELRNDTGKNISNAVKVLTETYKNLNLLLNKKWKSFRPSIDELV